MAVASRHLPYTLLQAVAVEKPVAASVEDILECHAVCHANDVPLYCSFQRWVGPRAPIKFVHVKDWL